MASTGFEAAKTVNVRGATLAWVEQGEGAPVVFVHGGVSDLRTWEQQLPAVGASHRAIAYSRRFARPNADIALGAEDPWFAHVDDLAALLRAIGAAPAHLVGNSQGAFISLLTAVHHPALVRSLVLAEPPVLPLFVSTPPRREELLRLLWTRPRTALAIISFGGTLSSVQRAFERGADEDALRSFGRGVCGPGPFERLPEARRRQIRENASTLRAMVLGNAGFPALRDAEVRSVRAPTLLVTGRHSPAFLLRLTDRLEELLPVVQRVEIASASHLMHEENAPDYNAALLEFLSRVA